MERHKDEVMMAGNKEGVEKVLQEDGAYAYFMESTSIEYIVERNCQLQQIGGLLDSKSYGIALPHGTVNPYIYQTLKEIAQTVPIDWEKITVGFVTCEEPIGS